MIRQVLLATTGVTLVVISFYLLIPSWNGVDNGLTSITNNNPLITPAYALDVQLYGFYLNILFGYSFLIVGIGVWINLLLQAWRREATSYALSEGEVV